MYRLNSENVEYKKMKGGGICREIKVLVNNKKKKPDFKLLKSVTKKITDSKPDIYK